MKLQSMTDFVIVQNLLLANKEITHNECGLRILKYANFLKQPLTLGMFVPCDDEGNVWEEPKGFNEWFKWGISSKIEHSEIIECQNYHEAKEKVLFKGFTCKIADWCDELIYELDFINYDPQENVFTNNVGDWLSSTTIEDLFIYANETADTIKLSKAAIKQIGL